MDIPRDFIDAAAKEQQQRDLLLPEEGEGKSHWQLMLDTFARMRAEEERQRIEYARRAQGLPGQESAPSVRDYTQDGGTPMPAAPDLNSLPTAKRIATGSGRQESDLDRQVAALRGSIEYQGAQGLGVAETNAAAALKELADRKLRTPKMEDEYKALLENNKRQRVDPFRAADDEGSAPVFRSLVAPGLALLGHGNIRKGLADYGSSLEKHWTGEEARLEKKRDKTLAEGLAMLGFKSKDIDTLNAAEKERLAVMAGLENAKLGPINAHVKSAEVGVKTEEKKGDWKNRLDAVAASDRGRADPLATFDAVTTRIAAIQDAVAKQGGKPTPQQVMQLQGLQGMLKAPKEEKFDKNLYDSSLARLGSLKVGRGKAAIPQDLQLRIAEGVARGELDPNRLDEYVSAGWPK